MSNYIPIESLFTTTVTNPNWSCPVIETSKWLTVEQKSNFMARIKQTGYCGYGIYQMDAHREIIIDAKMKMMENIADTIIENQVILQNMIDNK